MLTLRPEEQGGTNQTEECYGREAFFFFLQRREPCRKSGTEGKKGQFWKAGAWAGRNGNPMNHFKQTNDKVKCAEGRAQERRELEARRSLCTQAGAVQERLKDAHTKAVAEKRSRRSQGTFRRPDQGVRVAPLVSAGYLVLTQVTISWVVGHGIKPCIRLCTPWGVCFPFPLLLPLLTHCL